MPRIDVTTVPARQGSGYPKPFDAPCSARTRRRLGEAGGLRDFGVNLMTLVEDGGETLMRAGDCAAFPKGTGNGHHLINRSSAIAVYLEVGSRNPNDLTTCSDIDMMSSNADGRFVHKDGTPFSGS